MIGFAAESFAEDIPSCAGPLCLREALVSAVQRLNRPALKPPASTLRYYSVMFWP